MRAGRASIRTTAIALLALAASGGSLVASAAGSPQRPFSWSAPRLTGPGFTTTASFRAVSCPSATLCVAVDGNGDIVTSDGPFAGGGRWTPTSSVDAAGALEAVSCASAQLCVAVGGGDIAVSTSPSAGARAWKVVGVERQFSDGGSLSSVSCPAPTLCVAGDADGDVVTATVPTASAAAWTITKVDPNAEGGTIRLACPVVSLCVGVDGTGGVLTSTDPSSPAGTWQLTRLPSGRLDQLSCPTSSLCVATGRQSGRPAIASTTSPALGAAGLTLGQLSAAQVSVTGALGGVSCPSRQLCVIADGSGGVLSTMQPTTGASSWQVTHIYGSASVGGVSCVAASSCVALEGHDMFASADPAAGRRTWLLATTDRYDTGDPIAAVACPSRRLCVAIDGGDVLTSTEPGAKSAAWKTTKVDRAALVALACPSRSLCVADDGSGNIVTSVDPTGGRRAWRRVHIRGAQSSSIGASGDLFGISCPTVHACVTSDGAGNIITSDDPTGGAAAWKIDHTADDEFAAQDGLGASLPIVGFACPAASLCAGVVNVGGGAHETPGYIVTSTDPTGGARAWRFTTDSFEFLSAIACPSRRLCVALDGGDIDSSTTPVRARWHETEAVTSDQLEAIACPTGLLCIVGDSGGDVVTSTDPTGGTHAWRMTTVDTDAIDSIACASARLCVAGDDTGHLLIGR
jgi:hypothetical protein